MGSISNTIPQVTAATKLRRMLQGDDIIVAPGVYDGFSARIALEVGFDCVYMVSISPILLLDALYGEVTNTMIDGCWHLCFKARSARSRLCYAE